MVDDMTVKSKNSFRSHQRFSRLPQTRDTSERFILVFAFPTPDICICHHRIILLPLNYYIKTTAISWTFGHSHQRSPSGWCSCYWVLPPPPHPRPPSRPQRVHPRGHLPQGHRHLCWHDRYLANLLWKHEKRNFNYLYRWPWFRRYNPLPLNYIKRNNSMAERSRWYYYGNDPWNGSFQVFAEQIQSVLTCFSVL